jgi:hypothetical protein
MGIVTACSVKTPINNTSSAQKSITDSVSLLPSSPDLIKLGYENAVQTGDDAVVTTPYQSFVQRDFKSKDSTISIYIKSYKTADDADENFEKKRSDLQTKRIPVAKFTDVKDGPTVIEKEQINNITGPSIGKKSFYSEYISETTRSARYRLEFLQTNLGVVIFIENSGTNAQKLYEIGKLIDDKINLK